MPCSCIDTPIIPGNITTLSQSPTEVRSHIFACLLVDLCISHLARLVCLRRTIYLINVSTLYNEVVFNDENCDMFFEGLYNLRPPTPQSSQPNIKRAWVGEEAWLDGEERFPRLPELSPYPRKANSQRLFGNTQEVYLSLAAMSDILKAEGAWLTTLEAPCTRHGPAKQYGWLFDGGVLVSFTPNILHIPSRMSGPPTRERRALFEALLRATSTLPAVTFYNVQLGAVALDEHSSCACDIESVLPPDREKSEEEGYKKS
ncbi:hypothetical protein IAR50_002734 [Cryptococcus sp. DSM 104548]